MKFIVMEIQNNAETTATIVNTYDTYLSAQNAYHNILASAAVSTVEMHGAVILTSEGVEQEYRMYSHIAETPEPTPSPEE